MKSRTLKRAAQRLLSRSALADYKRIHAVAWAQAYINEQEGS